MAEDNRKYFRFSCQCKGEVRFGSKEIEKAFIKDISHEGIGLTVSNLEICPESNAEVRLDLPGEKAPLLVTGKVRWSQNKNNQIEVGIELDPMDKETKWKVMNFGFSVWQERMKTPKKTSGKKSIN